MLICGVQPVLLGAMVTEHRLSSAELGWATTAEFLTLGVAISAAGAGLKTDGLRWKIALAAVVSIIADLLVGGGERGLQLITNRAIAGLAEGLLVWCTVCMIARSSTPARWSAIFLTAQGITQLLFAAAAPPTIMTFLGANGGFYAMAGASALALLAVPAIPKSMVELPSSSHGPEDRAGIYTPTAIASLISVFLIAAFSIGLFAYLAPLATQAHLNTQGLGLVVSIVLGTSIAGSSLAAVLANRITYFAVFSICMVINIIVLMVLGLMPGLVTFAAAAGVFGFFWMFFLPFQLPFVIESDPTRRIAVIVPGAQLLGGAAGPLICSFFVTDGESRGSLYVCGLLFLVAFAISTVLHVRHLRRARVYRAAAAA
jgi:MFS family permease